MSHREKDPTPPKKKPKKQSPRKINLLSSANNKVKCIKSKSSRKVYKLLIDLPLSPPCPHVLSLSLWLTPPQPQWHRLWSSHSLLWAFALAFPCACISLSSHGMWLREGYWNVDGLGSNPSSPLLSCVIVSKQLQFLCASVSPSVERDNNSPNITGGSSM